MVRNSSLLWQLQAESGPILAWLLSKGLTEALLWENIQRPTCLFPTSTTAGFHKALPDRRLQVGEALAIPPTGGCRGWETDFPGVHSPVWSLDSWHCPRMHHLHLSLNLLNNQPSSTTQCVLWAGDKAHSTSSSLLGVATEIAGPRSGVMGRLPT